MKNTVKTFLSWLIIPSLLLAHYLTQHSAFLFLVGLVAVASLLVIVVAGVCWGVWVMGTDLSEDADFNKAMVDLCSEMAKLNSGWRVPAGWIVFALVLSYLLYFNAFVVATLFLISTLAAKALSWVFAQTDEMQDKMQA